MNPLETSSDIAVQIAALRRQVFTLLLALIVVSGSLTVYLYYQQRVLSKEISALKPQSDQIVATFKQNQPNLERFISQLVAYGNTHPDYQKAVLSKYPFTQVTAAPAKK